jgi:hypothetical protein
MESNAILGLDSLGIRASPNCPIPTVGSGPRPTSSTSLKPAQQLRPKGGGFLAYSANFAIHSGHKPVNSAYTWDLLPFRFKTAATA